MPARVLLVGLDGATFDLIEPWAVSGDLPHLAHVIESGTWGRLRSTTPPATFPAWTSLMTGVNPGQHGVFDFTRRLPGRYAIEFLNATYRQRPSVWRLLSDAGLRVGVMGFPATYPPETINGFLISGFDSPVATGIDPSFVSPAGLYDDILKAVGPYEITGFQEVQIGPGWHEQALRKLLHAARRRTEIASYLLDREQWDCFAVHFGESDTVAHHFWAFHDPGSPRYDEDGAARFGQAILEVYRELDLALGVLLAQAGSDATLFVVSDHGSGGTGEHVIHLNAWLAQNGWLRFAPPGLRGRTTAWLKSLGLALPAAFQEWVFRGPLHGLADRLETNARLGGLDWAGTRAFSEETNTFPSIWINVRGREPGGVVEPGAEYEQVRDQLLAHLLEWPNPESGEPVIARAWRREELFRGSALEDAPDVVLEPALDQGYAYTLLPTPGYHPHLAEPVSRLAPHERWGAKGGSMNGSHRPDGILILHGAGVRRGAVLKKETHVMDVAPSLLHRLDAPLPAYLDGRVLDEAFPGNASVPTTSPGTDDGFEPRPYSVAQAETVARKLRGLGYQV
jgi:predicted AlkP superfamily phosphohydrolase/phosphomutase